MTIRPPLTLPAYTPSDWELVLPGYPVIVTNFLSTSYPDILGSLPSDSRWKLTFRNMTDAEALALLLPWKATGCGMWSLTGLPAELAAGVDSEDFKKRLTGTTWTIEREPTKESVKNGRFNVTIELIYELTFDSVYGPRNPLIDQGENPVRLNKSNILSIAGSPVAIIHPSLSYEANVTLGLVLESGLTIAGVAIPQLPSPGVALLLHMDGSNGSNTFTDSSGNARTVTPYGNAQISTAQSKFGGASGLFDGSGDYLTIAYAAAMEPGSADLTWEMWIKTTASSSFATLYSRTPAAFASGMYALMINQSSSTSGNVALYVADYSTSAGSPLLATTGVSVRDDSWHHIAVVRSGSSWAIYVDGTSRATNTWSGTIANLAYGPYIGRDQFYTRDFPGYIDELRITNGIACYNADFTLPTAAFPDPA